MKFFILFACALAAASAGHYEEPLVQVYHGPQHLPIIDHEGVPVDTAEVQHARAAHLAHKINVHARNGDYEVHAVAPIVAHSAVVAHEAPIVAHSAVVAHESSVVSYSSDVAHVAPVVAHSAILAHAAPLATSHSSFVSHGSPVVSYAAPWAHEGLLYRKRRGIYAAPLAYHYGYAGPQHLPIINHEGVPVDTAEVQHARAAHLIQKANVHARNGDYAIHHEVAPLVAATTYAHAAPLTTSHASIVSHGSPIVSYAAPWAHEGLLYRKRRGIYAAPLAYHYGYAGPQHLPIINHEGVPVDTAEVQHARAAHLIQKANVHARNGDYAIHHEVAPLVAATTYAHAAPLVASSYAHVAHSYAAPWSHYY